MGEILNLLETIDAYTSEWHYHFAWNEAGEHQPKGPQICSINIPVAKHDSLDGIQ